MFYLGLAIHNHQPVGNFPWVVEEAYQKAYLPMLQALEKHPGVRLSLHNSGPLLDFYKEEHPEYLRRLRALVERGQVEVMTGGYFEPILPAVPYADQRGQVEALTGALEDAFGRRPSGAWLTERVWEPSLPRPLHQAGIEWIVVDDTHFKAVGLEEADLLGYYLTEEEGHPLKVFPSSKFLRYSIPWKEVRVVIDHFRYLAERGQNLLVAMGDDGEKFGVWPHTYQHCWEYGWMEQFFSALEENSLWLETIPLGEYARDFPPRGLIYLPCASYDEMLEWALPPEKTAALERLKKEFQGRPEVLSFLRGGFWRHFLAKYPEANWMHKRMLRTHRRVYQALEKGVDARLDLWRAQSNCPYWHGVFGGLYLADLRAVAYQNLLRAERQALPLAGVAGWEEEDIDLDGQREVIYQGKKQSLFFKPHQGGALWEWDLYSPAVNLLATLARRPEAYHQALAYPTNEAEGGVKTIHDAIRIKEKDLPPLSYDSYVRASALDHFLDTGTTREGFAYSLVERGDFLQAPFDFRYHGSTLTCHRAGTVAGQPFLLEKEFRLRPGGLAVRYRLSLTGGSGWSGLFASEWNFNLLGGGHNPQAYYRFPGSPGGRLDAWVELSGGKVSLGNRYLGVGVTLRTVPPTRLWLFPVETISNSEGGLERVYQGTCLVVLFPVDLTPGQTCQFALSWQARTEGR